MLARVTRPRGGDKPFMLAPAQLHWPPVSYHVMFKLPSAIFETRGTQQLSY